MDLSTVGFFAISALLIVFSIIIIESKKTVHYVLFLFVFVLGVSSMFLFLNAVFLSIAELIIYNGGIVLILAVSIMLMPEGTISPSGRRYILVVPAAILALLTFLVLRLGPTGVSGTDYSGFGEFFIGNYGIVLVILAVTALTAIITTIYFINREEI
ncbi:MAG: NADH-quinone oxidoreductase subunit J [Candidatus Parvarchaeota archaeon]|nr:NADH-quinone oxidoreductase subunit J [Candidatus Parvarchaeota archaeon]